MQSHRVEKQYPNRVVRPNNNLPFLDLHGGVEGCKEMGRLHILVHGVISELMHRLGTVNAKQDHISLPVKELQYRG